MDIVAAREKLVQQIASSPLIVVVEIHLTQVYVKRLHLLASHFEFLDQDIRKIFPVKSRPHIELRIDEPHVLQLMNRIGNLLRPILAARLDHAIRKSMKRNIEDVTPRTFEPGSQAAVLIMMLQQQHRMSTFRQYICASETTKSAADYHDIVLVLHSI